jgi:hypothetical protein
MIYMEPGLSPRYRREEEEEGNEGLEEEEEEASPGFVDSCLRRCLLLFGEQQKQATELHCRVVLVLCHAKAIAPIPNTEPPRLAVRSVRRYPDPGPVRGVHVLDLSPVSWLSLLEGGPHAAQRRSMHASGVSQLGASCHFSRS